MPKVNKKLFWKIIDIIENNLTEDKLIDKIVNDIGYSKRYVYLIFKYHSKMNIGMYIRKRKLTKAAILVKYTRKSIYNIALDMNFSSQQAFCRAFKRQFNVSPKQYRMKSKVICCGLFKKISKEEFDYKYEVVFKKQLVLKTTTLKYKENILKNHCRRGAVLKLKAIVKLSKNSQRVYVSSTIQPVKEEKQFIDVISVIGVEDGNHGYITRQGLYAKFEYNGLWMDYIEYSRNCFISIDREIEPYPVIEEIVIDERSNMYNPKCYVILYIPVTI